MKVVLMFVFVLGFACVPAGSPVAPAPVADRESMQAPTTTEERSAGQEAGPAFLAERGAQVEFLGLVQWTPGMLLDSLAVHAPETWVASPGLPTILYERLGFRDVVAAPQSGDSAVSMLVAVIEPQDSTRIRRRRFGAETEENTAPWTSLVELVGTRGSLLGDAMQPRVYARAVALPPAVPIELRPDSSEVRRLWDTLEPHGDPEDLAMAGRILISSPNVQDRLAAVAILSGFDHHDAAWHALVGALLDPDPRVRVLAGRVLEAFATHAPRRVNWRPATQELHAILDGSSLAALYTVLDALVATGVGPDLAEPVLRNGGHAVLMFAEATSPSVRLPSHRFLRTVNGSANRMGTEAWRAWIMGSGR